MHQVGLETGVLLIAGHVAEIGSACSLVTSLRHPLGELAGVGVLEAVLELRRG